jgi:hypothetical protein
MAEVEQILVRCLRISTVHEIMMRKHGMDRAKCEHIIANVRKRWADEGRHLARRMRLDEIEQALKFVYEKSIADGEDIRAMRALENLMSLYDVRDKARQNTIKAMLNDIASIADTDVKDTSQRVIERLKKNASKLNRSDREAILGCVDAMSKLATVDEENKRDQEIEDAFFKTASDDELLKRLQ